MTTEEEIQDKDGVEVARDALEAKAKKNADGLNQGELLALSIFNLADVLDACFGDEDDEDEEEDDEGE